jgi:CBS domain containing-hemolysin-like protein
MSTILCNGIIAHPPIILNSDVPRRAFQKIVLAAHHSESCQYREGYTIASLVLPLLHALPSNLIAPVAHTIASVIAFAVITFLHVVLGELAPKSIALQYPEETAFILARPTVLTENVFHPFIWLLNGTGNLMLRLVEEIVGRLSDELAVKPSLVKTIWRKDETPSTSSGQALRYGSGWQWKWFCIEVRDRQPFSICGIIIGRGRSS